jgi:hypothetical protein
MGWPQYLVAAWLVLGVFSNLLRHGKPSSAVDGPRAILITVLFSALLGAGGFWGVR